MQSSLTLESRRHAVTETAKTSRWLVYLAPLVTTVAGTLLRLAIAPLTGTAVPFVTYFAGAVLLAWFCGFWPAALSIALAVLAGSHYILNAASTTFPPWGASEQAAVIGFAITSTTVSFLIDFQRRTLNRARRAERRQAAAADENARLLEQAQQTQAELRRFNQELRLANRDLEDFAYSASHDLQEPVRTIALSAQLIEQNWSGQPRPEDAVFLLQIRNSATRMQSLITDLLSYARAAAHEDGTPPNIQASHVLDGVLENMRGSIEATGATISMDALPAVPIHESRLAQIFQNLISNAIKYRNDDAPRIHISASTDGDSWVFSVADNGIGIPVRYGEQIFGLFKRLHGQDAYPGNGIGLAVCQRVIEQYGGRVWLEQSAPGKGSTFCFSVPASAGR